MRGFGETTYDREDGWSPVGDAVALLEAAGLRKPIVVASSMGGQGAVDLALAHPERVGGLVLIGSAIRGAPYPESEDEPELYAWLEAAEAAGDLDEVNRLEAWLWLDGPSAPEGRVGGAARELFLEMNGRALRAPERGEEAEPPAAWPRLREISVPTLVMVGRLDERGLQEVDEQAARAIPGARFRPLDGVAHLPHLEGDPATLEAIEAFVDSLA
jgi:pimeloyl-ACP methyl ester carboxylesterase